MVHLRLQRPAWERLVRRSVECATRWALAPLLWAVRPASVRLRLQCSVWEYPVRRSGAHVARWAPHFDGPAPLLCSGRGAATVGSGLRPPRRALGWRGFRRRFLAPPACVVVWRRRLAPRWPRRPPAGFGGRAYPPAPAVGAIFRRASPCRPFLSGPDGQHCGCPCPPLCVSCPLLSFFGLADGRACRRPCRLWRRFRRLVCRTACRLAWRRRACSCAASFRRRPWPAA